MEKWKKIAKLAQLEIKKEEEAILKQVEEVIHFFEHIQKVDTKNTPLLVSPLSEPLPMRPDETADNRAKPPKERGSPPSLVPESLKTPLVIPSHE